MISVIQRVREARVAVGDRTIGSIGIGLVVLMGIEKGDDDETARLSARKIASLRIFGDDSGKMNRSVGDVGGAVLAISQFTLAGSIRKGRRPSFERAERPERALTLFDLFVQTLRDLGLPVETGEFGAMMIVSLENDGPVTFTLRIPDSGFREAAAN